LAESLLALAASMAQAGDATGAAGNALEAQQIFAAQAGAIANGWPG